MPTLTPPARAALALLVLITVVGVAALAVMLNEGWASAEEAAYRELGATAHTLAAVADGGGGPAGRLLTDAHLARLRADRGLHLGMADAQGRFVAASDPEFHQLATTHLGAAERPKPVPEVTTWRGEEHYLAVAPVARGAYRVLALKPVADVLDDYKAWARRMVLLAALTWLVGALGLVGVAWYGGRRTAERMEAYALRLAALDFANDADPRSLIERASSELGAYSESFATFTEALGAAHRRTAEAKSHVAALLQINPHYVLLCTLDGHVVDANPAFYAMSGLPFEAVRGNRIEVLNEVMPVEPLFELARRSLREGSSIGGIDYALLNRDDVRRPVQVALRAVLVGGKEAVMIQATDVAEQRNLERQIATFSDALDLMVDQRVAQLTAGNVSLGRLFDEAGVIYISFDEGGGTRCWSRAAETLTGRRVSHVPHFAAFTSVLGLSPPIRDAFSDWFWGPGQGAFVLDVPVVGGSPYQVLWRKTALTDAGWADRHLLVGLELGTVANPTGDGQGGPTPLAAAIEAVAFV